MPSRRTVLVCTVEGLDVGHYGGMTISIPTQNQLVLPTLKALRELGGSGTNAEIDSTVVELEQYTEEQQSVLHGAGPRTEIAYRLAWARTYLKNMGLVENSSRGVWRLTEEGKSENRDGVRARLVEFKSNFQSPRPAPLVPVPEDPPAEVTWQDELLEVLVNITPDAFERLAKRLLREAGFINTMVLGKSGDGGLDGVGSYRISLLSFPVFFQCKRYRGSVGSKEVRDFRGAMAGRGEKGLLITTGSFTNEAKKEASRDGAPPVDLIDGPQLCELLKRFGIGVQTTERVVEDITVDADFFHTL